MVKVKKILAVLVCAAMVCTVLPCVGFAAETSGTCGDNLTWTLVDGVLTISGTGDMEYYDYRNKSPWDSSRESIISVVIEDGVTSIGHCAFSDCTSLTRVTIGAGVTSIGTGAFEACKSLTSIDVAEENENYTSIDGVLFDKAVMELIQYPIGKTESIYTIPDGVTSIGYSAFENCTSLTSVTMPDGFTSIGGYAFFACSLASITIPDSMTSISYYAFCYCESLTDVYYGGTEAQWAEIEIDKTDGANYPLNSATIHCNYVPPTPEIKAVSAIVEENEINITAEIANASAAKALAIGYGTDGEYVSFAEINDGAATLFTDGVKTVKVFVWESIASMRPLCAAKEVVIE